ncbi:hypothetical protein T440DRAFT_523109 [Plenodomus tracheiphilus IPT5]|uniref:Uncharacterized protein n=1 Tax=Plenodomus tracheiphilus IPT5 TaxID=1408161 RepID=A0A6A7ANP4_9PLEO|nr:hypothetical protein T440DRAFT_523109 [Plenodomus tracheiphilus IPT5]
MSISYELADFFARGSPSSDPDIHHKATSENTQYSRARTWKVFERAYMTSKKFQQILGSHGAGPYATSPEIPRGLEPFVKGVVELEEREEVQSAMRFQRVAGTRMMHVQTGLAKAWTKLIDIQEEFDSPVRAGWEDVEDRGTGKNKNGRTVAAVTLQPILFRLNSSHPLASTQSLWGFGLGRTNIQGSQDAMTALPINIEPPSPKRNPLSRKRTHSTSSQRPPGPPFARFRTNHTTGLPTLLKEAEELWRFHFPRNTRGLLKIRLPWLYAMQSFSNLLPSPKLLSFHPSFPYPVERPVFEPLLSVAFYDTNVYPHEEVLFLGPGNVAEMNYCEVDTFRHQDDLHHPKGQVEMLRGNLGLPHKTPNHPIPLQQRAAIGEGRWCYVLIKGHVFSKHETAPHLMLAYPFSAITDRSLCLCTPLSDDSPHLDNFSGPYESLMRAGSSEVLISQVLTMRSACGRPCFQQVL